jgi:hypothetical protein
MPVEAIHFTQGFIFHILVMKAYAIVRIIKSALPFFIAKGFFAETDNYTLRMCRDEVLYALAMRNNVAVKIVSVNSVAAFRNLLGRDKA